VVVRFVEFSLQVCEFCEDNKSTGFACVWLGTHPVILFFRSTGLEVNYTFLRIVPFYFEYSDLYRPYCATRTILLNHGYTDLLNHGRELAY
jgi:hypothetical protein